MVRFNIYELEAQLVAHKNAEPSVIRVGQSLELPQVTVIGSLEITLLDPIFMRIWRRKYQSKKRFGSAMSQILQWSKNPKATAGQELQLQQFQAPSSRGQKRRCLGKQSITPLPLVISFFRESKQWKLKLSFLLRH